MPSQETCPRLHEKEVCLNDCHAHMTSMCLHAGAMRSPGFVSPAVIMHEPRTPAMDVFSVGMML